MKSKKALDIIDDAIIEFYMNSNIEDLTTMAKEDGYDIEQTAEKRMKLAKQLKMRAMAASNRERDSSIIEKAEKIIDDLVGKHIGKSISELKALLQSRGLQVQFRNIDKLDEQTIRELLKDIDFIELIEKIEKENQ